MSDLLLKEDCLGGLIQKEKENSIMNNYVSPVIFDNDELAEGVYATNSGSSTGDGCYLVNAIEHQKPEDGRGDFRFQVNAVHNADHNSNGQVLVVNFNLPVEYKSSNGTLVGGDGTTQLRIAYSYWNNYSDNIGLGDVVVVANAGISITSIGMECTHA